MKIVEVITTLLPGGAERFIVSLSNQLALFGHDVTLVVLKDVENESLGFYVDSISEAVTFKCLNEKKCGPTIFFKVYKSLSELDADVIHIHSVSATFFCGLSMLLNKKSSFFVTCHNKAESERGYGVKFHIKHYLLSHGYFRHIAISHANAESIERVYGITPSATIYNGISKMTVSERFEEVRNEVSGYKQCDDTKVFSIMARCTPQKNIPRLIRCFNELKKRGHDIVLLIMGSGYDNEIGRQAQRDALPHIHFLNRKHNVQDYLALSDFFTLSSDYEGMPLSLIEAISFGCIPVCTPVSGCSDIIVDGEIGFISKSFSDEDYINALERAVVGEASIDRDSLKRLYVERFTMENCARQYESQFKDSLSERVKTV